MYERTPLHHSVYRAQKMAFKMLIDNGANVNAADNKKMTPLHYIASLKNDKTDKTSLFDGDEDDAIGNL